LSVEPGKTPVGDDKDVLREVGNIGGATTKSPNPSFDVTEALIVDLFERNLARGGQLVDVAPIVSQRDGHAAVSAQQGRGS
jgi:hypothetical protein